MSVILFDTSAVEPAAAAIRTLSLAALIRSNSSQSEWSKLPKPATATASCSPPHPHRIRLEPAGIGPPLKNSIQKKL